MCFTRLFFTSTGSWNVSLYDYLKSFEEDSSVNPPWTVFLREGRKSAIISLSTAPFTLVGNMK